MAAVTPSDLRAFPGSPYATELQRGSSDRWQSPSLEAEFTLDRLRSGRTLIRLACAFSMIVPVLRVTEQAVTGSWNPNLFLHVGPIVVISLVLTFLAFSRMFERFYLPTARVLLPLRGSLATIPIAGAAAHGHYEPLMLLPLMVVGPFFFLGLPLRSALVTMGVTVASYIACAVALELPAPVALRSAVLMIMAAGGCALAARHLERRARTAFLENRLIAELAEHDALTGTKNRRVLDEHLTRLWQQALDDGRAIAVLLIDVDHFKAYNDRYGHQAGDHALRLVAQTMKRFVARPLDVLARYGGEEFAAVLYDIDAGQAQNVAEGMRRAVRDLGIEHRESRTWPTVTLSVGVATIRPSADRSPRGALQLADKALYQAKARGRNRVEQLDDAEYVELVTGVFSKDTFVRGA